MTSLLTDNYVPNDGTVEDALDAYASLMRYILKKSHKELQILPVNVNVLETGSARKNDKRPAKLAMYCPDDWVLNLFGNPKLTDMYVVTRIPRELIERYEKRQSVPEAVDPVVIIGEATE